MEQKSGTPVNLELTRASLAPRIDHTFLKPYGTPADIERLCREAKECGFAMVAVTPAEVERCVELLKGSTVRVGAAIGFPLGQNTVETKTFEIHDAISKGATEIDMVINVRALQAGNEVVIAQEIREMVGLCAPNSIISKVILETCYLTDEQKQRVCQIAVEEGANFVKTSTGFGSRRSHRTRRSSHVFRCERPCPSQGFRRNSNTSTSSRSDDCRCNTDRHQQRRGDPQ